MRQCPPEITQIAAEVGLGEVVDRYRQSLLIELTFVLTCVPIGLWAVLAGDRVGKAIGAGFLGLAVLFAIPAWLKSRRYLYLCENGLLTVAGPGIATNLLTWDDVSHIRIWVTRVYQLGSVDDIQRCVLELISGKRLNLSRPPYAHAEDLAEDIERRVTEVVYPRRITELSETGVTQFGPISITTEGVAAGARFASWSDISRIERGRVRLRIWTGAGRPIISRRVRTTPDVAVLVDIVSKRMGSNRERTTT